ncbi:competence/damage-inducible protein A [Bacillus sp. FJAT-45350]|uniref:competence/damage-inducible protein A n=1 Tax=Bacillus sp. FJAT-45350 TaxID=2011014 RepID=UPI000BB8E959|nr:competence/damage-inducible protein A [Bacillus sp. FJAT-45350]
MNAEIIAVGSELLLGQIVNTNASFISKELADKGINVYYQTVVGDNASRLKEAIVTAQSRANLIILSGGLGPTQDDLTKETVAQLVNRDLQYDEVALEKIEQYFQQLGRAMSENNKKQALVIEEADVLINENGMAPGMAFVNDSITYMLLPGPPKELEPMFAQYGINYLMKHKEDNFFLRSRVLRFFGIGESQLEHILVDIIEAQSNPTIAPLAGDGEVTLRLTVKHTDENEAVNLLDEVEGKIVERVGKYLYGYDDTSLFEQLLHTLQKNNLTMASAESLTGGMFSENITSISGASSVFPGGIVSYGTEIKKKLLQVHTKTIENYGVVSEQCANEMAEAVKTNFGTTIGISFTGVAGPTRQEGKDIGTVFIGIAMEDKETMVFTLKLAGTREQIRERAVKFGCYYLLKELKRWNLIG